MIWNIMFQVELIISIISKMHFTNVSIAYQNISTYLHFLSFSGD